MGVEISGVTAGSLAGRNGISAGDTLLAVNLHEITDVLDYQFYITEKKLDLSLLDKNGSPYQVRLTKPEYADIGLEFDTYLMDKQRSCRNQCVFCFIDQMPPGLRETLYFKDDDTRLSFLFGNYITLTNITIREIERIIQMRLSPINISVHTTNPSLRVQMMKNVHAGEVLSYLPQLAGAGILLNAQIVLCPGINDGAELERTLQDLCGFAPGIQSISVVPAGLTRYRDGLAALRCFTKEEAQAVIEMVDRFGDEMERLHGDRICHPSDEFYLLAAKPFPPPDYYGDYLQLENGVGMCTLLEDEFLEALEEEGPDSVDRKVSLATGTAAAPLLQKLAGLAASKYKGLQVAVHPILNDFMGHNITVAGLVCGQDLVRQLEGKISGGELLVPQTMLRHEQDLFLDDTSIEMVEQALGCRVRTVAPSGEDLLRALLYSEDDQQDEGGGCDA